MYIGKFHKYAVAGICLVGMQNDHAAHIVKVASDALIKKGFKVMIFNAFTDMFSIHRIQRERQASIILLTSIL